MASPLRLNTIRTDEQFYHPTPPPPPPQPKMIMMPQGAGSAETAYGYRSNEEEWPVDQGNPARDEYIQWLDSGPNAPSNVSVSPSQPPSSGLQLASSTGGGDVSRGPSDFNWITAIGGAMQSAGAAHFGNYGVPQSYMQLKQQADARKQAFAMQQAQLEEQKNQHHMQTVEKLIATGNPDALIEYGKSTGYAPASLIGQAVTKQDLAEIPRLLKGGYLEEEWVKSVFDKEATNRPTPGQIRARVKFATEMAGEDYKGEIKTRALDRALELQKSDPTKLTQGQMRLIKDHQTEQDLKQSQSEEHKAKAEHFKSGGDEKDHSLLGRVAEKMFGKPWAKLEQPEKEMAYAQYRKDETKSRADAAIETQRAQISVPNYPTGKNQEDLMNDMIALDHISEIKGLLKPEFLGRVRGTIGGVKEWSGLIGYDESRMRNEIQTMKNNVMRARAGLAVTESEAARIDKEVPDMTNSPTVFAARMDQTEKNLLNLAKKRRKLLKQTGADLSKLDPLPGEKADPESRFNQIVKENGGDEDAAYKQMKKEGY